METKIIYSTVNYPKDINAVFAKLDNEPQVQKEHGERAADIKGLVGNAVSVISHLKCVPMRIEFGNNCFAFFKHFEQDDYKQVYAVYRYEKYTEVYLATHQ